MQKAEPRKLVSAAALVLAAEAKLAETWEDVVGRVERQAEERGRLKAHVRAQRDAAATLAAARRTWENEAAAALAERLTQRDAAASEALALARREWEDGEDFLTKVCYVGAHRAAFFFGSP